MFFPRSKVAGSHAPASSATNKNEWSCTSIPPRYLHVVDKDKQRDFRLPPQCRGGLRSSGKLPEVGW
jgi:hypothetical protein